ncbi:MAG: putative sulfate exporter family transporter [Blastocatellia bacterium]|nr:putative sulfate exporter family transporter [Blastocatellia bacterium]
MPTRILFFIGLAACLLPFVSTPIALGLGLALGLSCGNPYPAQTKKFTKLLLQVCVVGLGFGINLHQVVQAGQDGFLFTVATIVGTLVLGFLAGKWLKLSTRTSHLIASGTAICGGSAIAAVGPVLHADDKEMSVSLGTVFILNSIALFLFPFIGHKLHLTQNQFGIWAAIAIHDTSSVVGAAVRYGAEAATIATTVKLARALWIGPLVLVTAWLFKQSGTKTPIPYFIGFFFLATVVRSYVPLIAGISPQIVHISRVGLTVTLYLIGVGFSRKMVAEVGLRPLLHGVILWIAISVITLWSVLSLVT